MKQFRMPMTSWQIIILLVLIIFLWSNRQADGTTLCEFRQYEDFQGYDSAIEIGMILKFVEFDEQLMRYHSTPLFDGVPLLDQKYVETNQTLKRMMDYWPSVSAVLPMRVRNGYYHWLKVTLTPQQMALMQEAQRRGANLTVFSCSTKIP